MPQHREMAQAAIIPALRGWEGPVGREEAGLRGSNAHPMSREEQPYRVIHRAAGEVEHPAWFITPKAQEKHCHPMPCTRGLMGGAGSFGAVFTSSEEHTSFLCQWQRYKTCLLQSHIAKP